MKSKCIGLGSLYTVTEKAVRDIWKGRTWRRDILQDCNINARLAITPSECLVTASKIHNAKADSDQIRKGNPRVDDATTQKNCKIVVPGRKSISHHTCDQTLQDRFQYFMANPATFNFPPSGSDEENDPFHSDWTNWEKKSNCH